MSKPNVAVLGLGLMGSGMARSLLRAGHPVSVYNRSRERAEPFAAEGARVAGSPGEAAEGADIVLSMVADDEASRTIWLGERGALAGARDGAVLVESSTVTVDWVRELAQAAAARGLPLLDAPVTGSRTQAAGGDLLFLVGGSAEALERARPALSAMGRAVVHLGPTGSGALVKLVNNFLCGVQAASLAEAVALVEASGLDREQALEVFTGGAPGSPLLRTLAGRMTDRDYTPHFLLRLMIKDLAYAVEEGEGKGVPLTTAACAREVFERAKAAGHGERDLSAVVEPLRRRQAPVDVAP